MQNRSCFEEGFIVFWINQSVIRVRFIFQVRHDLQTFLGIR